MKVKNLFAIALASIALFACSNDDEPTGGQDVSGKDTWAAFSIQLPKTVTRSVDDDGTNATTDETEVKCVAIYVKQSNGHMATSGIKYLSDYSDDTNGPTYKAKIAIPVKTGEADVWAVVNPSQSMHDLIMGFPANEAFHTAFSATVEDMAGGLSYANQTGITSSGFVMTNYATKHVTLTQVNTEKEAVNSSIPNDAKNHFTIQVERAVAKVAVISTQANVADLNGIPQQGDFTKIKYYAAQVNKDMYMARWVDATEQSGGANIVTPGNDSDGTTVFGTNVLKATPLDINPLGTEKKDLKSIYLLENSMKNPLQTNATHVVIEAVWTPKTLYMADGTTKATGYATGDDFWFYNSKYYKELPQELVAGSGNPEAGKGDDYKWTGGKCYYWVYLYDKYTTTKFYDVVRNTVYNVNISSIKAPGSNVPTPPPGPISEQTYVTATVNIAPWTLADMDNVDLQ